MGESLRSFLDAVEAFGARLAAVDARSLAVALVFVFVNYLLRTWAWRNIIAAAYPDVEVRWRTTFGAYTAGVAVNALVPARLGDAVKLMLVHRRVEGAAYPTLAATLVVETLVDAVVAGTILVVVWQLGLLPFVPELPSLPAFELTLVARNPEVLIPVAVAVVIALILLTAKVRAFWERVKQGFTILTTPGRYLRQVAVWQLLGWGCRLVSAWFFLEAFHVPPSLEAVVLVQVASSVATLFPATPGGLGPKQALLVVMLGEGAARADVLAYSVGQEIAGTVFAVLVGGTSLVVMLRGFRFRRALAEARTAGGRDADPSAPDEPPGDPPPEGGRVRRRRGWPGVRPRPRR